MERNPSFKTLTYFSVSGHSKFANIKHKKEKNDAAKGKIFTRLGREIAVAVKEGGSDPNNNSKLKDIVAKAKANNMPNDTIAQPCVPTFPFPFVNAFLTLAAVRFLLSVNASTIIAVPLGPYPS